MDLVDSRVAPRVLYFGVEIVDSRVAPGVSYLFNGFSRLSGGTESLIFRSGDCRLPGGTGSLFFF